MYSKNLIAIAIVAALSGCSPQTSQPTNTSQVQKKMSSVDQVVENYTLSFIKHQPALATSLKLDQATYGNYATLLPDYSPKGMRLLKDEMNESAEKLKARNSEELTEDQQLHLSVNEVIARYYAGFDGFSGGYIDTWGGHLPYIVNQLSGPLVDIPTVLKDQHTIESLQDAKNYLVRLDAFAMLIQQVREKIAADAFNGIILPKVLFPNTLGYLNNFKAPEAQNHALVTSFASRVETVSAISQEERQSLIDQATQLVATKIYPGFDAVIADMTALEEKAPVEVGIDAQPNGAAFYQHEITYLADSTLSAEAIHQVGLDEVSRITKRMDEILTENGLIDGSVSERMQKLNYDPRFIFEDSDKGREALLTFLRGEIETINQKAPLYFSTLPTQAVEVKRIPKEVEAGAPGGYYNGPSLDGSRPGVFAINLKDMNAVPSFGLKTLTYHEAVPGHHFQIALNMLQTDIGLMRQNASFNAYIEGWALYSELVAYEMGMYENDPFGDLGRLQAEAYRAARLVVDTGLHFKKWTRQQAIDYFAEATGSAMSDVTSAIDRYIAWPGQALGYKLGMIKLVELREMAKTAMDSQFDLKTFHDIVLLKGARPMALVEADIKAWIEKSAMKKA
ncbi:FIG01059346: hypothetical protein [Pseudoalteromonas luteoviolacea B = ATCC 29581]|nr:FIG01059346: hypothetical protein [Pseudoalteromonas luteoviolacea B = ATCC 29581]